MRFSSFRWFFLKHLVFVLLALFLLPGLTLGVSQHVLHKMERSIILEDGVRRETLSLRAFCARNNPVLKEARASVCPKHLEQFFLVRAVALGVLTGGVILLGVISLLGFLAFLSRAQRLFSLAAGRALMILSGLATVLLQGSMLVWLIYWIPRIFWNAKTHNAHLIGVTSLSIVAGAVLVVRALFRSPEREMEIEGEQIPETAAPHLWKRIRQMAARLKTKPPDHLIAGIDSNFFVTETPLVVKGIRLYGRKLFVSLPLLRQMHTTEADAILAHELAHFSGGDTQDSALLHPRLAHYDAYLEAIYEDGVAGRLVYPFMVFFRLIFELALSRESRESERRADRLAARLTSPLAVSRALLKVTAYATYRDDTETALFESRARLTGNIGLSGRVARGLATWARSPGFSDAIAAAHDPHPFDSHPSFGERMTNVRHIIPENEFAEIVASLPNHTWLEGIDGADALEQKLWSDYERRFAEAHEESLA
ncbi:MAG: M48 family metallopeptidase [Zoogloeaceae bacterium]|jgi:Zn-dependent protease with chaperone function|nr:M48 family metallopeptidase [Zoogloeaceae bacterium]